MKVVSYLIIIFFAPVILLLNFHLLVFNNNFYKSEFRKLNVYQQFSSQEEVNHQTQRLIQYLCCNSELDGDFFSEREKLHLADVKNLIRITTVQFILMSLLLTVMSALLIKNKKMELLISGLRWGSFITVVSVMILWISSLLNFEVIFVRFHYFAFDNDLWQLPPESNLIKLFPQQFFVDFANRIAIQTVLMSAVIFGASYLLGSKFDTKKH